jgi:hypothetical protein
MGLRTGREVWAAGAVDENRARICARRFRAALDFFYEALTVPSANSLKLKLQRHLRQHRQHR